MWAPRFIHTLDQNSLLVGIRLTLQLLLIGMLGLIPFGLLVRVFFCVCARLPVYVLANP